LTCGDLGIVPDGLTGILDDFADLAGLPSDDEGNLALAGDPLNEEGCFSALEPRSALPIAHLLSPELRLGM
jgi:hypothetical protein